jgi:hypothetical protein
MAKRKYDSLPFFQPSGYDPNNFENRLFHERCSGEVFFQRRGGRYGLLGECDRCGQAFKVDLRTLRKHFRFLKEGKRAETRQRLIKQLRGRPLYPVSEITEFDVSDKPVMVRFDNGAALVRDPQQPHPPIVGVFAHGTFRHVKKNKPKQLLVTRTGGVRGKRPIGA